MANPAPATASERLRNWRRFRRLAGHGAGPSIGMGWLSGIVMLGPTSDQRLLNIRHDTRARRGNPTRSSRLNRSSPGSRPDASERWLATGTPGIARIAAGDISHTRPAALDHGFVSLSLRPSSSSSRIRPHRTAPHLPIADSHRLWTDSVFFPGREAKGGPDDDNWPECIRTRRPPIAHVGGARSVTGCHPGNLAYGQHRAVR